MCSKNLLLGALSAFIAFVAMVSCTPKVGEAPPPKSQPKLESLQCVSNLKPLFRTFFEGEATDQEVAAVWDCSRIAVKNFKQYVYGRAEDRFEADEIAKFLEDDFFEPGAPKISKGLQAEVMQWKRLLVGGSESHISRAELDTLDELLIRFKAMSLRINPYMKLLIQSWGPQRLQWKTSDQIQHFENASHAVEDIAEELAKIISAHGESYELDHFVPLAQEVSNFARQDSKIASIVQLYLPTVKKVKVALAGGADHQVAASEWHNFLLTSAKGYLQYLRHLYFVTELCNQAEKQSEQNTAIKKLWTADEGQIRFDYLFRSFETTMVSFHQLLATKPKSAMCGSSREAVTSCITKAELTDVFQALSAANNDLVVSDLLLAEVLKLKILYFGGTTEALTVGDLERGAKKSTTLRGVVEKLLPHYSIFFLQWNPRVEDPSAAKARINRAIADLNESVQVLGGLFEGSYDLQSLNILLTELESFGKKNPSFVPYSKVLAKYLPLLTDVKNAIYSDRDLVIRKAQWPSFLALMAKSGGAFLQYHYFMKDQPTESSGYLEGFKGLMDQVSEVLSQALRSNKNHVLATSSVNKIAQDFKALNLIPKEISEPSLQSAVTAVVEHVLWPAELRMNGSSAPGITAASVTDLQQEVQIWYETERFLRRFAGSSLHHQALQNEIARALNAQGLSRPLKTGLTECAMILSGSVTHTVDSKYRQEISRTKNPIYDLRSLSQLNLHRAVGRLAMRSAITDRTRLERNQGVNLQEAQALFAKVRPLLVDLGLIDRTNLKFIESRFRESNVFAAHSNGDSLTNFEELTDIVGMIFSGVEINAAFRKNLMSQCKVIARNGPDIFVAESCVYEVYYAQSPTHLANMPQHLKTFEKASPYEWGLFFKDVLKAAGHVSNKEGVVQLSILNLAPHVIQYMEMLYSKYDEDQNGLIDTEEAKKAYPAFSGLLAELTKDERMINPRDLPALFTYILNYGKPPTSVFDFFQWLQWKDNPDSWHLSANRQRVAGIFAFIAEKTRALKSKVISAEDEQAIRKDPRFPPRFEDDVYHGG